MNSKSSVNKMPNQLPITFQKKTVTCRIKCLPRFQPKPKPALNKPSILESVNSKFSYQQICESSIRETSKPISTKLEIQCSISFQYNFQTSLQSSSKAAFNRFWIVKPSPIQSSNRLPNQRQTVSQLNCQPTASTISNHFRIQFPSNFRTRPQPNHDPARNKLPSERASKFNARTQPSRNRTIDAFPRICNIKIELLTMLETLFLYQLQIYIKEFAYSGQQGLPRNLTNYQTQKWYPRQSWSRAVASKSVWKTLFFLEILIYTFERCLIQIQCPRISI